MSRNALQAERARRGNLAVSSDQRRELKKLSLAAGQGNRGSLALLGRSSSEMKPQTYKATFRKKNDGLAINSFKVTAEALPSELATETKELLKGNVAPDGFTIEVVPRLHDRGGPC